MTTIRSLREHAIAQLIAAGILDAAVDADLLIGHVIGASRGRVQALMMTDAPITDEDAAAIARLVTRRVAREPLQHITGQAPFRSLVVAVGPGVFVPRPETEQVAQIAIDALASVASSQPVAVDLGTGSGAIALAMATEVPQAQIWAVENSPQALVWATRNFTEIKAPNAHLVPTDLASALTELDGTVDVVISNPPYIPADAVPRDPEVRLFDPQAALYGGEDGLDVVRVVSQSALRLLHMGGTLVLEHGELQAEAIRSVLLRDGWRAPATHCDWSGRDRATSAIR